MLTGNPHRMKGPMGAYAPAESLVESLGYDPLRAKENEFLPDGVGSTFGASYGPAGRGMTDEEKVRAYGYEGGLSPMQNDVPPSMRGIESRPNASVMLQSAQANIDSGLYKDMNEAMAAQIALNKKIPQYDFAENVRRSLASQEMVKRNDQARMNTLYDPKRQAALRASAGQYDPIRQGGVPGGGTDFSPTRKVIAPLASRSLGASVAARNVAPLRRRSAGRGSGTSSARRNYSSVGRSARNNFRGL